MAISVNWPTKIISIPKADTTLLDAGPPEIRELDLDTFRLILRDLEDNEDGMPFPRTHRHNTEVTVGGFTLARVIEIINGYTVTFEDGNYAVDLVGANSNVGDVVNLNQVSIRSYNSAGLIVKEIEASLTAEEIASAVSSAILDKILADHDDSGSVGEALNFAHGMNGGRRRIINDQEIFYKSDNITEIARFNLKDADGQPSSTDVYERERV